MTSWLAPAYLALSLIILVWDIVLAGRIAQLRQAPRPLQAMSGLIALLALPAVLLALATSTIITGRAVVTMDWVWPALLVLFAAQAVYALARGLVNVAWGVPIAVFDLLVAAVGIVRYLVAHGVSLPEPVIALLAAQNTTLAFVAQSPAVVSTPFYLVVPMVAPAFPALRRLTAVFRFVMAAIAFGWLVLVAGVGLPPAIRGVREYDAAPIERLRERPNADFDIGLKILPDVGGFPSAAAVRSDFGLVDTLDVDAVSVVFAPDASRLVIDSVGRVLDRMLPDSTQLIVAIGYRGKLLPELAPAPLDEEQRLTTIRRIMARLHPDVLLPAEDPYGVGARVVGRLPVETWKRYFTDAARVAKSLDRRIRIGLPVASFSTRDSALYAWAAAPGSPIDIPGFSLLASPAAGAELGAQERAADRWMRAMPPTKDHWVFATGGYPLAYGEKSQERAIWHVLAWATDHAAIKGLVVYEAGDYGQARGLRAPNGRLRSATFAVMRAIRGIRESAR
jgi:hypothetical protein